MIEFITQVLTTEKYKYMHRKRRSSAEIARLIDKVTEEIALEKGFSNLSIQEVCERAQIEPSLFYRRYPEGFSFYVEKFIREHDFWLSHYDNMLADDFSLNSEFAAKTLTSLWQEISSNNLLASAIRMELQDTPSQVAIDIANERELRMEKVIKEFTSTSPDEEISRIQLAVITAGIQYLALHKRVSTFCGIDFQSVDSEKISMAIQQMITTEK